MDDHVPSNMASRFYDEVTASSDAVDRCASRSKYLGIKDRISASVVQGSVVGIDCNEIGGSTFSGTCRCSSYSRRSTNLSRSEELTAVRRLLVGANNIARASNEPLPVFQKSKLFRRVDKGRSSRCRRPSTRRPRRSLGDRDRSQDPRGHRHRERGSGTDRTHGRKAGQGWVHALSK